MRVPDRGPGEDSSSFSGTNLPAAVRHSDQRARERAVEERMELREWLAVVLNAAHRVTGTYGDVGDRQRVTQYLKAPADCDFKIYAYVYKIPLGNFYAHSEQAFDKASLWQEIEDEASAKAIPQPPKWGITTTAGEIALWIDDQ